jgi:integrase
MPRKAKGLTARFVETAAKPGMYADGGGLYLAVGSKTAKSWILRYPFGGKRREMGLGSLDKLALADARIKAEENRGKLARGIDPMDKADAPVIPAFGEFSDDYVKTMRPQWRNPKHAAQWAMTLREYAKPIRAKSIDSIGVHDVLAVLKPLWARTPETAERLRGRIENVLDAARAKGFRSGENPARWRGHLDQLLPKRQRLSRGHHAAMPYGDVPAFMAELRSRGALAARALELTILTACRSGEVLHARWREFDLTAGVWTVPAERMKAGKEHRVPLSERALGILGALRPLARDETAFVFSGRVAGKALSNMGMGMLMRRMGRDGVTVHGFRSAFRDWAAECTPFPHEVCEMALAHTIGNKAEAAYRRGDLFDKRRALMDAWALHCEPKADNVLMLERRA